jgi:amino acid transporter/nucleotide-binding universal stress UspA family protein
LSDVKDNSVSSNSQQGEVSGELSRDLSLFHITMMGLGMMIGAGVFLGMGVSIGEAGPGGVVLTFTLNGLLAMLTAMSFAELSSAIPRAGGAYNFARIGFGRGASFMAGWMEWFASSVAGSMYSLTFSLYTIRFFRGLGWLDWIFNLFKVGIESQAADSIEFNIVKCLAITTACLFIYINFRGSSETGKIGAIITMGQTAFVLTIGVFGIMMAIKDPSRLDNFTPFMPKGWSQLLITMGFTYVAFEGYEVIAQAGDEAIDPKRNLPKAMIYSVTIVTLIYILVAFATVVSVKPGQDGVTGEAWSWIGSFGETGFGEAVSRLMPYGNFILTLAVIFSSTSALNATVYSATRASYALGRDGMLPKFFAKIDSNRNTPIGALICTGALVLVVATCLPTKEVASSASIMFLFLFFLVNVCVIKIRRSMADELSYGFLMPFFPVLPILAIACQIILAVWLVHMSVIAWIIAPIWLLAGASVYFFYARTHAHPTEDEIQILHEQPHVKKPGKYPVMVAIANPANASELVQTTYRICGAKDAQVELIHMTQVPDQIGLMDARNYVAQGQEALTEAMLYLSMQFPISTTIRYCRNIARGIVSAIREKKVRILVMGWHGKRQKGHIFNIGATVDPIIEQSPCNIVLLKDCGGNKEFKNVLVPVAGGPNGAFALEIAAILSAPDAGKITLLTVDTGRAPFDIERFVADAAKEDGVDPNRIEIKTVKGKSVLLALLKESRHYDLVVLGTANKPILARVASRTLPERFATRCKTPLVMVKSEKGVRSWIRKWI